MVVSFVYVCARVCVYYFSCCCYQMKETWDYANIQERVDDAVSVKEKGTKYFRVSAVSCVLTLVLFSC